MATTLPPNGRRNEHVFELEANPMLWLDKACIDQQKIDESLAALPVYLSGCRDLLILVGSTYTRRLWCVMELCAS